MREEAYTLPHILQQFFSFGVASMLDNEVLALCRQSHLNISLIETLHLASRVIELLVHIGCSVVKFRILRGDGVGAGCRSEGRNVSEMLLRRRRFRRCQTIILKDDFLLGTA